MTNETTRGKLSSLSISYAAGFVDADGCIGIAKSKNVRNPKCPRYSLRITVMGVHKGIIDWFQKNFGGSVHCKVSRHGNSCYLPHHRVQWRWEATGNVAIPIIKQLVPYLIVKKEQGELAVKFQEMKNRDRGKYGTRPVPHDIINTREKMYLEMRELKRVGETLETYRSRRD